MECICMCSESIMRKIRLTCISAYVKPQIYRYYTIFVAKLCSSVNFLHETEASELNLIYINRN